MVPDEGEPIRNGAILWRGTSQARHFLGGNAMFLAGHDSQRFVAYPLTPEDPVTGLAQINWIAELRVDPTRAVAKGDWNRPADKASTPFRICKAYPVRQRTKARTALPATGPSSTSGQGPSYHREPEPPSPRRPRIRARQRPGATPSAASPRSGPRRGRLKRATTDDPSLKPPSPQGASTPLRHSACQSRSKSNETMGVRGA